MTYDLSAISAALKSIAAAIDASLVQPEPEPVEPETPVEPDPVVPVEPAPVEPTPADPAPVEPVPAGVLTTQAEIIAALKAARGGEAIHFAGDYPAGLTLKGIKCPSRVTLVARGARADFIDLIGCENIYVHGLTCYPTVFPLVDKYRPMFRTRLGSLNCGFIDCRAMGHASGRDYYNWTLAEWQERKVFALMAQSPFTEVVGFKAYGVGFGVAIAADDCILRNSAVFGFSTDGIRCLGDRMQDIGNTTADSFNIDPGHDDGRQSWEDDADMVLSGVVLHGYTHVDWLYDRPRIFAGISQGSGNFDGMYDGWDVADCTILTDHYHGMTFAGLTNSTIERVHCMTQNNTYPGYPAIRIDPAKATRGGFPSHHVTIRDCIAPRLFLNDDPATRIESGNVIGQPRNEALYQATLERVRALAAAP